MASLYSIEKLDESSYETWTVQMRSVLIHAGLWKAVTGTKPSNPEELALWNVNDEKALATILLCVKANQLNYVKNCKTSAEAWQKLQEVHKPQGPVQKVTLYKQLLNKRMREDESMVEFLNSFTGIADKLSEIGIVIQEELLSIILLSNLPNIFENFVIAIETRDSLPTFSALKVKILEEGERQKRQNEPSKDNGQQAFVARENSNKKQQKKFNGKCFSCGKRGHFANKCKEKQKSGEAAMNVIATANTPTTFNGSSWYIDSGATSHMCNNRNMFVRFEKHEEKIWLAANSAVTALGKGDVLIRTKQRTVRLLNVLYSPELKANFISISKSVEHGMTINFGKEQCCIKNKKGDIILKAARKHNLYGVELEQENLYMVSNIDAWHNRYGHLNYQSLRELARNDMVLGLKFEAKNEQTCCNTCMLCKIHVLPFPQASERKSANLLELIHSDVCGPINVKSVGGSRYFLTLIDDKSRFIYVYFLKAKNEVLEKFKIFKAFVERQTNCKIKTIRSDNGKEYVNSDFDAFLSQHGIRHELTVPHTPQQNGVAERANRTLVEMARCMMLHAEVQSNLWAEAVSTAAYLRNRCPTKCLKNKTPYEIWFDRKPVVAHLKTFGAVAVALDKTRHAKFDVKGKQFVMVGYSLECKAYRLYDKQLNRIVVKRDVLFNENFNSNTNIDSGGKNSIEKVDVLQFFVESESEQNNLLPATNIEEQESDILSGSDNQEETADEVARVGRGRPKLLRTGERGRPKKQYNVVNSMVNENIPADVDEALSSDKCN